MQCQVPTAPGARFTKLRRSFLFFFAFSFSLCFLKTTNPRYHSPVHLHSTASPAASSIESRCLILSKRSSPFIAWFTSLSFSEIHLTTILAVPLSREAFLAKLNLTRPCLLCFLILSRLNSLFVVPFSLLISQRLTSRIDSYTSSWSCLSDRTSLKNGPFTTDARLAVGFAFDNKLRRETNHITHASTLVPVPD